MDTAANDSDQEDWDLEILQALVSPSTAEDAALACAAAWMNFLQCERVAVAIFDSSDSAIVAHGQRDNDTNVTIYVGHESADISALMQPELLYSQAGPCSIEEPSEIICWPEHLSAVLVIRDEDQFDDDRVEVIKNLSRKLLSRWTTPSTAFANPDHMESMAEFAAGAGHEINNPLGSIIGQTQLLLKRVDRADQRQALETIGAQAWRIRDMVGDAMLFARPPQPEFTECDLTEIVERVVEKCAERFKNVGLALALPEDPVTTFGDESQLAILVNHLVANACEAVADHSSPEVNIELDMIPHTAVMVSVTDNGPEIPKAIRQHMFDPFFSGRQAGRGLGFGLCHSWQIARMHNGILTQESLDDGNKFLAVLPST